MIGSGRPPGGGPTPRLLDLARPPRLADRDADRAAATLHAAAWVTLATAVLAPFVVPEEGPPFGPESVVLGAGTSLLALALARSGRLTAASVVFLVGTNASLAGVFLSAGTVYLPAVGVPVLTVLLAGLLLGARAALVAMVGVFGLLVGLEGLFLADLVPGREVWEPRGLSLVWWAPTFLVAGTVGASAAARIRGALAEADRSQAELFVRHQALARSEARYRGLVEGHPLATATLDLDLTIRSVNAQMLSLLGAPSEGAIVGHNLAAFPVFSIDQVGEARRAVEARERTDFEAYWTSAWGKPVQVRVYLAPILGEAGEVTGAQAIVEDVTEQKRLEAQLLQSQKMEAAGRIAGGIAHDFNNYLTAILGSAEQLRERAEGRPDLQEPVEQILDAARRSGEITRQLLAFSRKQVIRPRDLDPNRLIEELVPVLERVMGPTVTLELALEGPGSPERRVGCVRADPAQLEVVLVNLAANARDAMPDGGRLRVETGSLTLDAEAAAAEGVEPGRFLRLRVSDTGHGMEEELRGRIFEPFFTTKAEGRGTGLGLATVHGVVAQCGGSVRVESRPGHGSCFEIRLPRVAGTVAQRPRRSRRAKLHGGSETILLVEDDAAVRRTARAMLANHGYTVVEAEDGLAALDRLAGRDTAVDLLVTDVMMPRMGGVELVDELRSRALCLPTVFISGYAEPALAEGRQLDPEIPLLEKPFTTEDLLTCVRERLDRTAAAAKRPAAGPATRSGGLPAAAS